MNRMLINTMPQPNLAKSTPTTRLFQSSRSACDPIDQSEPSAINSAEPFLQGKRGSPH